MTERPPSGSPPPRGVAGRGSRPADDVTRVFEEKAKAIAEATAKAAAEGDTVAARMILDRIAPAPKERAVSFDLPDIAGAADLPAAVLALVRAAANGDLVPGEAVQLASVLEHYRKQTETADLEERVRALEEAAHARKP